MLPIITIDGVAGSGKSTLAAELSKKLGLTHLNTGMLFRGLAWMIGIQNVPIHDETAISEMAEYMEFEFITGSTCRVNGRILGAAELMSAETGNLTRYATPLPRVRAALWVSIQKAVGEHQNRVVVEGRDVGKVLQDAYLKFYVQASAEVRVDRRMAQLAKLGDKTPRAVLLEQVIARDLVDKQRGAKPLSDVYVVDTSVMLVGETLAFMMSLHESRKHLVSVV